MAEQGQGQGQGQEQAPGQRQGHSSLINRMQEKSNMWQMKYQQKKEEVRKLRSENEANTSEYQKQRQALIAKNIELQHVSEYLDTKLFQTRSEHQKLMDHVALSGMSGQPMSSASPMPSNSFMPSSSGHYVSGHFPVHNRHLDGFGQSYSGLLPVTDNLELPPPGPSFAHQDQDGYSDSPPSPSMPVLDDAARNAHSAAHRTRQQGPRNESGEPAVAPVNGSGSSSGCANLVRVPLALTGGDERDYDRESEEEAFPLIPPEVLQEDVLGTINKQTPPLQRNGESTAGDENGHERDDEEEEATEIEVGKEIEGRVRTSSRLSRSSSRQAQSAAQALNEGMSTDTSEGVKSRPKRKVKAKRAATRSTSRGKTRSKRVMVEAEPEPEPDPEPEPEEGPQEEIYEPSKTKFLEYSVNLVPSKCRCTYLGCGKTMSISSGNRHVRSHLIKSGEKPYLCDVPNCNAGFIKYTDLKLHKKYHISVDPNDQDQEHEDDLLAAAADENSAEV